MAADLEKAKANAQLAQDDAKKFKEEAEMIRQELMAVNQHAMEKAKEEKLALWVPLQRATEAKSNRERAISVAKESNDSSQNMEHKEEKKRLKAELEEAHHQKSKALKLLKTSQHNEARARSDAEKYKAKIDERNQGAALMQARAEQLERILHHHFSSKVDSDGKVIRLHPGAQEEPTRYGPAEKSQEPPTPTTSKMLQSTGTQTDNAYGDVIMIEREMQTDQLGIEPDLDFLTQNLDELGTNGDTQFSYEFLGPSQATYQGEL